jgi:flagellar P-ring protein precursor FlgI
MRSLAVILAAILVAAIPAGAERIKDIVDIKNIRSNQLVGVGLVVGLNATGDGAKISQQLLSNRLRRAGLVLNPDDLTSKSIASVEVSAELPPFAKAGSRIDVTVSANSGASSLQGGVLVLTELHGADGEVYAVAQGPLVIGGFSASGDKSSISKNHPTVGFITGGATVEREEPTEFVECNSEITLLLKNPDITTAERIAEAINAAYAGSSMAVDHGTVRVRLPSGLARSDLAAFIDKLLSLKVKVDFPAVVVINERTGTVIIGENVGISTVAISHGNLSIITEEKDYVSQPAPFSETGSTEKTQRTSIATAEEQSRLHVLPRQVSVAELARALNAMGLSPRDVISIFQALRQAGALQAELKIM